MFTTKHKIAAQVLKVSKDNDGKKRTALKLPEVLKTIEPILNELLNPECININLPGDLAIPQDARVYYFEGLVPEKYNKVSRLLLPVKPLVLPHNLGVFHVSKVNEIDNPFIPVEKTELALIKEEKLLSDLPGLISYTLIGNYIVFSKDLTIEKDAKLIVGLILHDISSYDIHTPFFIPDDTEEEVIESCLQILTSRNQKEERVSSERLLKTKRAAIKEESTKASKLTYLLELYYEKGCKPLKAQQVQTLAKRKGFTIQTLGNRWKALKRDGYMHNGNPNNIKEFIISYKALMLIFKDNINAFNDVKNHYDQLKEMYPEQTY